MSVFIPEKMPTRADLVAWLKAKHKRHGELEDLWAAELLEEDELRIAGLEKAFGDTDRRRAEAYNERDALASRLEAYEKGHSVELERIKGELAARQGKSVAPYLARIKELEGRLDAAITYLEQQMRGSTHWEGCDKMHWPCAVLKLLDPAWSGAGVVEKGSTK
jgi:hypothetical protein